MIYSETKSARRRCARCGTETDHVKSGTNHSVHFLTAFLTMFLWTPVWILVAVYESLKPYRCSTCTPPSTDSENAQPSGSDPSEKDTGKREVPDARK